jgi:hypothetical protein
MAKDGLINCKKCGTLFFKTSEREICEECFRKELELIDDIKKCINSFQKKVTLNEVSLQMGLPEAELEDLVSRGRLFTVITKLLIK